MENLSQLPLKSMLFFIKSYQILGRPIVGTCCRFYPGCSDYAQQALTKHGAIKGFFLGLRRICRCHPFCPGGYDPVP